MTIGEWVARHDADAPPSLVEGVRQALGADAAGPSSAAVDALLATTERELTAWLAAGSGSRTQAVPLLTIDALVTLALEAVADDPACIDAIAERAMLRLSELDGGGSRDVVIPASRFPLPDTHDRSR